MQSGNDVPVNKRSFIRKRFGRKFIQRFKSERLAVDYQLLKVPGEYFGEVHVRGHRRDTFGIHCMRNPRRLPVRRDCKQTAAVEVKESEDLFKRMEDHLIDLFRGDIDKPGGKIRKEVFKR